MNLSTRVAEIKALIDSDSIWVPDNIKNICEEWLMMKNALEFYASNNEWFGPQNVDGRRQFAKISDFDLSPVTSPDRLVGGKLARETLQKLGER